MLAIQKVRIGLRQPAAKMNHPIKLTRLPKVSALPALTRAVLPARSGDKREHAVAKIAPKAIAAPQRMIRCRC